MASVQKPIISWQVCNFLRIVRLHVFGMIGQIWIFANTQLDILLNLKDSYFEPAVGSPPNFARMSY